MMHRLFRDRLSSNVSNLILKYRDSGPSLYIVLLSKLTEFAAQRAIL